MAITDAEYEEDGKEDVVKLAQDLYQKDFAAWSDIYEMASDDLFFLSDDPFAQWDKADYAARRATGRPTITVDQLSQFVHQVANDIRQNTPSIETIPINEGSDVETAEVYKGLIKNIEYRSASDDAYDTASLDAIKCSIGFIFVDHDYIDETSFDQELLIKRIVNSLSCYIDSTSTECDGRDAKHGFVLDKITCAEFKKRWPDKDPSDFTNNANVKTYKDDDLITVAQFFRIVEESKEVGATEDGDIEEVSKDASYKSTRRVTKTKVMRYWLSGQDVLEESTFPGKYIPIVPVYGEEAWREGVRYLYSLIRKAKDAQRNYNYWKSLETELLMKQPQAPVMVAEGQIEDYMEDWKNPGKSMALRYRQMDSDGNPAPPPQRLPPPQIPTGIVNAARETVDDIKATMGLYNASIGQRSNETSGIAIARRQQEGDVATFHFADNLRRSITQVGRILVSAIPEVYDTARIIRIIGVEGEAKMVGINGAMAPDQERAFDLKKGQYDVRVVTGPSQTTLRQETAGALQELFRASPDLISIMGDIYFRNSDFSGAQEMSERMKKVIQQKAPGLIEGEDGEEVDPQLMQAKELIQRGMQEIQNLQQQLASKQGEQALKQADLQAKAQDSQTKSKIDLLKLQSDQKTSEQDYQIKMLEMQIKQRELDLKEMELLKVPETEEDGFGSPQVDVNDENALASRITTLHSLREQKAQSDQQKLITYQQKLDMDAQREALEAQEREQDRQIRAGSMQALSMGLQTFEQTMQSLTNAITEMNRPKAIVYDQAGRVAGVQ